MKTYSAKPSEVTRNWILIDAQDTTLGRLATEAATWLTGKHKPMYTSHIDCGDYVVIINAARFNVTGNKLENKKYYRHSGYPGSLKTTTLKEQMKKDPNKIIQRAVQGMLPKNKLHAARIDRLKIYPDEHHPHNPQKPRKVSLQKRNNTRRVQYDKQNN